jgi:7-cyano-7-deazaguanine reductase
MGHTPPRPPGEEQMTTEPTRELETFPNPKPDRDYVVEFECPEFTCLCPRTGQPDFATLRVRYVPDASCVELKSLKLYLWSFRNEGAFHEAVVNKILDDLATACKPRFMEIVGDFYVRGGIRTSVTASVGRSDAVR